MIGLPAGCTVTYSITVELKEMNKNIVDWFRLVGGVVVTETHYNHRGHQVSRDFVQYGKGKRCHYRADGSNGIRLHFHGDDASVASMFLIKFFDVVEDHNLKEHLERLEQQY
jgi:hypothetical protein